MAKKPASREELLAQLEALDNSTEVAKLTAEVSRLTGELAAMTTARNALEKEARKYQQLLDTVRKAVSAVDYKARTYGEERFTVMTPSVEPVRDLSAGTQKVTQAELERVFPALSGPLVDVTETADALIDADLETFGSALQIKQG